MEGRMKGSKQKLLVFFAGVMTGGLLLGGAVACGKADDGDKAKTPAPPPVEPTAAAGKEAPSTAVSAPRRFEVDPGHSYVLFRATHFGTSHNYGRFNEFSGTFVMDEGKPAASSVELTVKAESVDTGIENRDNHLRTPDFFDVKSHPEIKFKSTKVSRDADGTWRIAGDFTLHGVTKSLTVPMKKTGEGDLKGTPIIGFEGSFDIKRSEYGMSNMIGPVGDDIRIIVAVEAKEKK
jgi:polyisoprenoid-binding protein YceI